MRRFPVLTVTLFASLTLTSLASADGPLVPATQVRHGQTVAYLKNLSKIAVYGTAQEADLRQALASASVHVRSAIPARDAIVLSLENATRSALTPADLHAVGTALRSRSDVRGTGPVYFDDASLHVATGNLWVYLPKGTGKAQAQNKLAAMGLQLVNYFDVVDSIAVGTPSGAFSIEETTEELLAAGYDVVPELMSRYAHRTIPTDTYFDLQWSLRNTGDNVTEAGSQSSIFGKAFADARVSDAWDMTTGTASTLIGVIDSGTDCSHPELAGKCEQPYNAVTNTAGSEPPTPSQDASGGHGTSVAGIVAAPMDGTGMVGACPDCRIVPVRLIESNMFLTETMMLRAFQHAVDAGAAVINNSWGPSLVGEYLIPVSQGELQGIKYAGQGRGGLGVLVVYAAGNENADTQYLGQFLTGEPNVMAIAASNHHDLRSTYSNFGDFLDIAAPTNDEFLWPSIISLSIVGAGDMDQDYTSQFGGTSAAAPLVSGVAGLILSEDPTKTAAEVREILTQSADKIDADGGHYDANGFSVKYGYGRVNAYRALLATQGVADPNCASPAATDDCAVHLDENCDGYVDEGCSSPTNVGLLCTAASECGAETFWECPDTGRVRGICTFSCTDEPCPSGAVCVQGLCAPTCNDDNPCPQTDTVCTDDVLGECLRRCAADTDCPTDEVCDPQLGYCLLDTDGLAGSPCTFDECLGSQPLCLSASMGFEDGYCTHVCSDNGDCEDSGKCIPTMNGSYCFKGCTFDGDCRQQYVCEQAGPRAGTCYKKCNSDEQCRGFSSGWDNIVCENSTGRCVDTAEPDAGVDASTEDGGAPDAAGAEPSEEAGVSSDAGVEVGPGGAPSDPGAAANNEDDGGCGCRTAGGSSRSAVAPLGLLLLGLLFSRRRASRL
jgi:MYXO-CTERM domain-containing protein